MDVNNPKYFSTREEWREWLLENFDKESEIWFVNPKKSSGKQGVLYNDAVEEALCFGWIDSTVKTLDEHHTIQRYTPRKPKSKYSQLNKERLKWLTDNRLIHPQVVETIKDIIEEEFVFPQNIAEAIRQDAEVWKNYQAFSDTYKRIRVAYIDSSRENPNEYEKRLQHFIRKTKENKLISGYGGTDKYY